MAKQQVIIFEGPDGTGKTEISKKLSEVLNIPRFKNELESSLVFDKNNSSHAAYNSYYMAEFLKKTGYSAILDRLHVSEYVYSKFYGRKTNRDLLFAAEIELSSIEAKIIYCYKSEYSKYSDKHVDFEDIAKLDKEYRYFLENESICNFLALDTSFEDLEDQTLRILNWITREERKKKEERKSKIVAISGYFDPLHAGHLDYINMASELGDFLVVIVNNTEQAMLKKGYEFMPFEERMKVLRNLRNINIVVGSKDTDLTVCKSLKALNPDIFANGGDRKTEEIPEYKVCMEQGIEIVDGLGGKIQSSSDLVGRYKELIKLKED